MLSETMRLELEPLGVGVQSVVLGIVRTRFHANLKAKSKEVENAQEGNGGMDDERFQLAEGSYYEGMRDVLRDEASGKIQDEGVMGAGEAGRRIVRDVVGGKKGRTLVGTKAGVLRIVGFLPRWLVVSFEEVSHSSFLVFGERFRLAGEGDLWK